MSVNDAIRVAGLRFAWEEDGFELAPGDLTVGRGEKVVLVGPSGCGKTTLLQLIAGILVPRQGSVVVCGNDWTQRTDAERRRFRVRSIGMVFQEFELLEHLTVRENVLLPYFVAPALRLDGAARARCDDVLASLGLARYARRRPRQLSHGERQRIAIGRALITEPELVLADEPTGNLDPETTRTVLEQLLAQAGRRGATLLMVTHDHGLLDAFDRVVDLADPVGARP